MAPRFPWFNGRRWHAAAFLFLLLLHVAAAAPGRPATRGITPSNTARIGGIDYLEAQTFFARYGLKASWLQAGTRLLAQSAFTKIELESNRAEVTINGLRVFLGEPVVARNKSLFIAEVDAENVFGAILRPSAIARDPQAVKVIALDPGHGGTDPGKENNALKLQEKKLTLDVAIRVKKLLEEDGYKVVLTRSDDRQLKPDKADDLAERCAIANRAGADLFVSIHFNAWPVAAVNGTETYILTRGGQRSTGEKVREGPLPGNSSDAWNTLLGYSMHRQVLGRLKTFDRGLKLARYKVLTLLNCPGVLVETAYLSNDAEARKLATAGYRQDVAEAIVAGINAYAVQVTAALKK